MLTPLHPDHRLSDAGLDAAGPRRWSFAGVSLDDGDDRLRFVDRSLPVQPVPLKLLRVLLAAAPHTVSRGELLGRVWHRAPDVVSRNVLSNAVARLREVLGQAAADCLVAVPGVGYAWRGEVAWEALGTGPARADAEPAVPPASAAGSMASTSVAPGAGRPPPGGPRSGPSVAHPDPAHAEADRFMTGLWLDVLRGRSAGHARMTLQEAVRAGLGRAEAELAASPRALAHIHRTLASHCRLERDGAGAARHVRRALELVSAPAGMPQPDEALELHFDLCGTLSNSVIWDGDASRLRLARQEMALALAALRRSPAAGALVHVVAARAMLLQAFYEHDWARALAASTEVVRRTVALPERNPRREWECRTHHAAILLRAGEEEAAIAAIEALFHDPPPPIDSGDVMSLQARMMRGALRACVGRPAEAVDLLEPLHAELQATGGEASGIGPDTTTWLARALLDVGRTAEALACVASVHAQAVAQAGATSEAALQPLATLARALTRVGRGEEALRRLQEGVGPHLARLTMPGQRYAVLALVVWIDLLFERGERGAADALARRLRPRDLRAAVLRPADAEAFFERCWRARRAPEAAGAAVQGAVDRAGAA